jgi:hypothetical protein
MNRMKPNEHFILTVFNKSFIAFPVLIVVFFVYGTHHEHGDANAGGMYPIVFAVQYLIITVVSNILYALTDKATFNTRINFIKNFAHVTLGVVLFWFHGDVMQAIVLLTLPTLLVVNLIMSAYNSFIKPV